MSWPCARLEDLIDRNKAAIALTRIGRQGRRRLLKNNKKKRRGVDSQNTKSTRSDRAVGVTHSRDRSRRVRGRASGAPSFFVWLTLQVPSCQRTRFVECRPSKGFARTWFGGRRGPCVAVVFIQLGIRPFGAVHFGCPARSRLEKSSAYSRLGSSNSTNPCLH